jgi:hypothetical protein
MNPEYRWAWYYKRMALFKHGKRDALGNSRESDTARPKAKEWDMRGDFG